MFESSFLEMLLVGVVALLVIGPERLPTVARTLGQWLGKIRRFIAKARADVDRELHTDELRTMFQKQEEELRNMRAMMQEKTEAMNNTVRKELEQHDKPN
ncbi:Sec-independent protein translocase protein TatB [Thiothrix fructosivorans]|jgi:sec-independent protein translocase protein TatB|uniref:Twin-arginine translocase subunit TatB n=1 Tax=Thiothrix fructosivorans TaxID=111770 RepID=A0A8B0SKW3_9GAMM|nr:Sec-independent protein translocase protein TatB [Thiothrix fructosivorans]MBO0612811.1 twin-arginine translocase subunit TatB [Thiothrix fructosivorans]QTX11731.1 twin-arginine translocase subunit TatB [Thiothrix fructosivorans]